MAKPIRRLIADLQRGRLTKAKAAELAVGMLMGSPEVPKRYRLGAVTEYDLMVLGVATGASAATASTSGPSSRATSACTILQGLHSCVYTSTHTSITYILEGLPLESPDPDVVPDYVTTWASVADSSWAYYKNTLGMTPTADVITIFLGLAPEGSICGSLPTAQIICGSGILASNVEYLSAHEMFHQFQWHYVDQAALHLFALNPWMESTANWASAHFAATTPRAPDSVQGEAANIGAFFDTTNEGLVARGDVTGGLLSGLRAYGSVPVVEFLASWTQGDPSVESTFVKESFEAITAASDDALTLINDALSLHDTSVGDVVDQLWWSIYTMCDTANPWSPFGWCDAFGYTTSPGTPQTQRPAHDVVSLSSTPTGTSVYQLNRYGAEFVDFDLGTALDNVSGTSLVLEFDSDQVATDDQVLVQSWADTPGGAQCGVSPLSYPASSDGKTAFAFQIPSDCRYATLVAVNKRTGTWSDPVDFPVSWSSFSAGVTIGNGTVTLGVNPEGNLGLGVSRSWVCRAAQGAAARYASNPWDQGPALMLDATGFDAIREQSLCYVLPTQGWSVVDPNHTVNGHPATWSKHGLDYPTDYPVSVISFTATDSEATSVVALGGDYALTQHWHPSTVDPRVYQLDVTIQQVSSQPLVVDLEPFTYRQVVPLSVVSENGDAVAVSVGTGDGVSAATNSIYWPWAPDDAPGFIDDPLVPLPPASADAANGFAFDANVQLPFLLTSPDPGPQLTLYYGLADTSAQANSLLNAAGATTRAIAQRTNYDESTLAILVGLHKNT